MTGAWRDSDGLRTQTVTGHQGRTRTDLPGDTWLSSVYEPASGGYGLSINRGPTGDVTSLLAYRDASPQVPPPRARLQTGDRMTLVGETCALWRAARAPGPGAYGASSGCVTPDGIELWTRQDLGRETTATGLDRRPVTVAEVTRPWPC